MSNKLGKFYLREIRDQLGRYPNWPIGREITLGKIGYLDGWNGEFDWRKTLGDLGISVGTIPSNSPVNDTYSTEDAVTLSFTADSGIGSKADVSFSNKKSISFQGYETKIISLNLDELLTKLRQVVGANKKAWDWNWLIITELWVSQAFTTLISGARSSQVTITAAAPPAAGAPFNIANPTLGLSVSKSKGMSYTGVAEQKAGSTICPFFQVHKLVDHPQQGLILKKYGDDVWWFG